MLEVVPKSFLKSLFSSNFTIWDGSCQRGEIKTPFFVLESDIATIFLLEGICYRPAFFPRRSQNWWKLDLNFPLGKYEFALFLDEQPIVYAKPRMASGETVGILNYSYFLSYRSYLVEHNECIFEIGRKDVLSKFVIFEHNPQTGEDAQEIGSIYVPGIVSNRRIIDLPNRLPIFLQVFLFWLAYETGCFKPAPGGGG